MMFRKKNKEKQRRAMNSSHASSITLDITDPQQILCIMPGKNNRKLYFDVKIKCKIKKS
jgi:hypothetical protein